jgi:hypothetical protein
LETVKDIDRPLTREGEFCYVASLPQLEGQADCPGEPSRSRVILLEDGKALGPAHSVHDDIRGVGCGRFSHWGLGLWFSTSDNSDPLTNGRRYSIAVLNQPTGPRAALSSPNPAQWSATNNPRKQFDDIVQYAVHVTDVYLGQLNGQGVSVEDLKYLEIEPGPDFAPQLVLASHGAQVTVADEFLANGDPEYHPRLYQAFLERWSGRADAIKAVLEMFLLVPGSLERLNSIPQSINFAPSNAALDHVVDLEAAVEKLARITMGGRIHTDQIDFPDHGDFSWPLDHLLTDRVSYARSRSEARGDGGTAMRMPEMVALFARCFWIWQIEINSTASPEYAFDVGRRLPSDDRHKTWAPRLLRVTGGRLWLVRKDDRPAEEIGASSDAF